jgi:WD40 repeat protein
LATIEDPTPTSSISASSYLITCSPDGRSIVTASTDGTAVIWDISDPKAPRQLAVLPYSTSTVVFSSDGRTLLTTGEDAYGIIWDVRNLADPRRLSTLTSPVRGAAFSTDTSIALSAGPLGTVQIWDVRDPAHPNRIGAIAGEWDYLSPVAFASDGQVALIGGSHSVVIWDLSQKIAAVKNAVAEACRIAGRGLSSEEWAQYVPGLPYEKTCSR